MAKKGSAIGVILLFSILAVGTAAGILVINRETVANSVETNTNNSSTKDSGTSKLTIGTKEIVF